MQTNFIFIEKANQRIALYGSLKALFDIEVEYIKKSKGTFYTHFDFDLEDYEDEKCKICKRTVIRSKHSQIL